MKNISESIRTDIEKIRNLAPLVHNITNYVVMNSTANALLSLGASPVMAHALEEVEEMTSIAGALVINIGTLSPGWVSAMHKAAEKASQLKKPIVLDPVGAGATGYRTSSVNELLEAAVPAVIRGNASEIIALAGMDNNTKGVDSTQSSEAAVDMARALSRRIGSVIVVSGAVDFIIRDAQSAKIFNGDPLMGKVTGMGCTATALIGAFLAVNPDPFNAAVNAMAVMGMAGEMAALGAEGPGTFQARFLDALYRLEEKDIRERIRVE